MNNLKFTYTAYFKRYEKLPKKAEIILIFSFTITIMLWKFSIDNNNGILGDLVNRFFGYIGIFKYLIITLPLELGIQIYRKYFYEYFLIKPYSFKRPFLIKLGHLFFRGIKVCLVHLKCSEEPVNASERQVKKPGLGIVKSE